MAFTEDQYHRVRVVGHVHMGAQCLTVGVEQTTGLVRGDGSPVPPEIVLLIERESHTAVQISLGDEAEFARLLDLLTEARRAFR